MTQTARLPLWTVAAVFALAQLVPAGPVGSQGPPVSSLDGPANGGGLERAVRAPERPEDPGPSDAGGLREWSAVVTKIIDADTIVVDVIGGRDDTTVRIAGLNANELGSPVNGDPECHSREATLRLEQILQIGDSVELRARSEASRSLGRDIRHVFHDGQNVASPIIADGLALPIRFEEEPDYYDQHLRTAQSAIEAGVNIWDPSACAPGPGTSSDVEMVTNFDAPGDDNDRVNGEWVQLRNVGDETFSLDEWTLRTNGLDRWMFPAGTSLGPGARIRVLLGEGTDTATQFHLGFDEAQLSNESGGVFLHDPDFDVRAYDLWPCNEICEPIPSLVIEEVRFDAPGDDASNPGGEWIRIRNVGAETVDLQDFQIATGADQLNSVASRPIAPGGYVTVYIGTGSNTVSTMYLNKTAGVLDNLGDVVTLATPDRQLASCFAWGNQTCGEPRAASKIAFTANFDAAGADSTNPNGEWVNIRNQYSSTISIGGHRIVTGDHEYVIPNGTVIAPDARLRIRIGQGTDTDRTLYWGNDGPILENAGETISLQTPEGETIRAIGQSCGDGCAPPPVALVIDHVEYHPTSGSETIRLRNVSGQTVDLADWKVVTGSFQLNPDATRRVAPGGTVMVDIGVGTNTTSRIFWQKPSPILNDDGGSVRLYDPERRLADCRSWGSGGCEPTTNRTASLEVTVNFDADGNDATNPNGEWTNLTNRSQHSIDLAGIIIETPGHVYTVQAPAVIAPGETLRISNGRGTDRALRRYWGEREGFFGNDGDEIEVTGAAGEHVWSHRWPCVASCAPTDDLVIHRAVYDAPGDDSTNPNGESVSIRNAGNRSVDIRNWKIVSQPHVFDVGPHESLVAPGEVLVLRIGSGVQSRLQRYWGNTAGILGNSGDVVTVIDSDNSVVACRAWGDRSC